MKKEKIKILYKEPGKLCEVIEIENTLEEKQRLVGGLIEIINFDDLLLICNEEGKLMNLEPNLVFEFDYIAGNCLLIGDDFENSDFRSLTDYEIEEYSRILNRHNLLNKGDF